MTIMEHILNLLTTYSNLILVIITGIYAYLTWRMVREMRKARENQTDSKLIATPVSSHRIYAEIQLENMGPGPAHNVELSISLDPPLQTTTRTWKHPVLSAGQKEYFLLPYEQNKSGPLGSLREPAEKHDNLIVDYKWKNVFDVEQSFSATYKLSDLVEGWYNAGRLIPPDDLPKQIEETNKTLDNIHKELEKITQEFDRAQTERLIKASNTISRASRKKKVK
jgi:hypothetical protein